LIVVDLVLICLFAVVYFWVSYNLPILAAGVRSTFRIRQRAEKKVLAAGGVLPSFSVVVPVKNEGKIVGRLFEALKRLDYPLDKVEVVVVEDGSCDDTVEVCRRFALEWPRVKVLQQACSRGKPSALNFALGHCSGDVVAVFDADNVPAPDALLNAAAYFGDVGVAAVQGQTLSINSGQNMLTQFISYEEAVWCEAYLRGKDVLGLFVHLKGSCQFIRREVLVGLGGFDEAALSEDMEVSAHLAEHGYGIRYGGDVCAWQESASTLRMLFRQRTRWFRGTMEVAFKYGRLMRKPSWRNFDAEATLFAPFIIIASLLSYVGGSGVFFAEFPFNVVWSSFVSLSILATTFSMVLSGVALVCVSKRRGVRNLLWLPFVFGYWCLQAFVALYAAFLILLRRPKSLLKTEKSGVVSDAFFASKKGSADV
jgi:cellulose synthase/poly-beta-1,6-N-acetylglucosamine synthase-like glycosyltransferase